jgi:hypothetical protein
MFDENGIYQPMAGFRTGPSYGGGNYAPNGSTPVTSVGSGGISGGDGGGFMSSFGNWAKSSGMIGSYDPATQTQTQGWGGLALGAGQGLFNGWLGLQQLGLAKDTLSFNKEQFQKNFGAQQKTTNARLEDRQRARVASNSSAYQSVGDYMQQNRI